MMSSKNLREMIRLIIMPISKSLLIRLSMKIKDISTMSRSMTYTILQCSKRQGKQNTYQEVRSQRKSLLKKRKMEKRSLQKNLFQHKKTEGKMLNLRGSVRRRVVVSSHMKLKRNIRSCLVFRRTMLVNQWVLIQLRVLYQGWRAKRNKDSEYF